MSAINAEACSELQCSGINISPQGHKGYKEKIIKSPCAPQELYPLVDYLIGIKELILSVYYNLSKIITLNI